MLLVDGLVQNHPNVTGQCLYKGETRCSLADMHLYEYRCERYHFFLSLGYVGANRSRLSSLALFFFGQNLPGLICFVLNYGSIYGIDG